MGLSICVQKKQRQVPSALFFSDFKIIPSQAPAVSLCLSSHFRTGAWDQKTAEIWHKRNKRAADMRHETSEPQGF